MKISAGVAGVILATAVFAVPVLAQDAPGLPAPTEAVENATRLNTIGDPELIAVWQDPDFGASERAYASPLWYTP